MYTYSCTIILLQTGIDCLYRGSADINCTPLPVAPTGRSTSRSSYTCRILIHYDSIDLYLQVHVPVPVLV